MPTAASGSHLTIADGTHRVHAPERPPGPRKSAVAAGIPRDRQQTDLAAEQRYGGDCGHIRLLDHLAVKYCAADEVTERSTCSNGDTGWYSVSRCDRAELYLAIRRLLVKVCCHLSLL